MTTRKFDFLDPQPDLLVPDLIPLADGTTAGPLPKDLKVGGDWICEACNGPLIPLGRLGSTEHARCRSCGLDHSRTASLPDDDCCNDCAAGLPCSCEDLDLRDAIVTQPGESLIDTVRAAREDHDEPFANDWKPRP